MFPASAVRTPPARSRSATSAVVVDLPFVPVMHRRAPVFGSAIHSAVAPTIRTPFSAASAAGDV